MIHISVNETDEEIAGKFLKIAFAMAIGLSGFIYFMQTQKEIDGIVASVERLAMQIYLVSLSNSINIPHDLKVIAFSTLETAPILNPSLTTVTQPAFDIGKSAAEILFTLIEKKKHTITADTKLVLPSALIERNSTMNV